MSRKWTAQASRMLISRMPTPSDSISRRALVWVRSVVPKPGIVTPRMLRRGSPNLSNVRTGYQQGERRIKPAGDTDDGRMRAGMPDALRQSADLDAEDFFAALLHLLRIVRDERARIETAFDRKLFAVGAQGDRDAFAERAAAVGCKGIGFAPQGQRPVADVRFRYGQLFFEREAFRFVQKDSVFGDQAVAGENHVGRRFAESGRAVQVSRQRAGRLLGDQRTEISVLADHFVACRQIDQQGGPGPLRGGRTAGAEPTDLRRFRHRNRLSRLRKAGRSRTASSAVRTVRPFRRWGSAPEANQRAS